VIVFLPPEGRIAVPLHDASWALLGRATFLLPLALAFVGVVLVVRRLRPDVALPRRRLAGIAALLLATLPIEHLLGRGGDGTGLVGHWLSASLLDLLGVPGTVLLLVVLLGVGIVLAFDLKTPRATQQPHAEG
jgi:hypothetical protein